MSLQERGDHNWIIHADDGTVVEINNTSSSYATFIFIRGRNSRNLQLKGEYDGILHKEGYGKVYHDGRVSWEKASDAQEDLYFKIIHGIKPTLRTLAKKDPEAVKRIPLYYFVEPFEGQKGTRIANVGHRWYADMPKKASLEVTFEPVERFGKGERKIVFKYYNELLPEVKVATATVSNGKLENITLSILDENNIETVADDVIPQEKDYILRARLGNFEKAIRHMFKEEGRDTRCIEEYIK